MCYLVDFIIKKNQNKEFNSLKINALDDLHRQLNDDACDLVNAQIRMIELLIRQFLSEVSNDMFKAEVSILSFIRSFLLTDFYNGDYVDYHLLSNDTEQGAVIDYMVSRVLEIQENLSFSRIRADKIIVGYKGDDIENFEKRNRNRNKILKDIHDILIAILMYTQIEESSMPGYILGLLANKLFDDLELSLIKINKYAQEWEASRQLVGK